MTCWLRLLSSVLVVILTIVPDTHQTAVQDIVRSRVNHHGLLDIFDQTYTLSDSYGLHPTIYALSTYYMHHFNALEVCDALGGHLAEINSLAEMQFVTNFLRQHITGRSDIAISGFRLTNTGTFQSLVGVDLFAVINAYRGNPGNPNTSPNFLYFDWHHNRPRNVVGLPTCLTLEKRGDNLAMNNLRCDFNHRRGIKFLCEVQL